MLPTIADKAYAAGVIDSDGCIRIVKEGRSHNRERSMTYYIAVFVKQADGEAIEHFHRLWGGSVYVTKKPTPTQSQMYHWQVTYRKAEACLLDILPYLRIKRGQAKVALELADRMGLKTVDQRGRNLPMPIEEVEAREELFQGIKQLKLVHNAPRRKK